VGEILAGVILGPSVLSKLFPEFGNWLLPETYTQSQLLDAVGLLGIIFLMVVVGLETDLGLIRARWKTAAGVGFGGLVVPFGLGFAAALFVPEDLLGDEGGIVFALFLAVALALSAIPVLAKILSDLGLLRREFGQTALAAGMIDDICGWALLGMVISLASSGSLSISTVTGTVVAIVAFFAATFFLARPLVRWSMDLVTDRFESRDMVLTLVVALAFGWGAFSQWLHLEPILGAFAIGVLFGQIRRMPVDVVNKLESLTNGVLAPIFLATAGLRLRVDTLLEPRLLVMTLALFLVAAAGKLGGGFLGGRFLARTPARDALGFGVALNARGVLGIVVATIGLSMRIFGVEIYSMIVVTSVLTSMLAPVALKAIFSGQAPDEPAEDGGRTFSRVLLPVRVRADGEDEVRDLEAAALGEVFDPKGGEVTLLSVVEPGVRREAEEYQKEVAGRFPRSVSVRTRVARGDPVEVILGTAAKGHDLLALGAPDRRSDGSFLFGPVIDDLVRLAPCPTLVFRAGVGSWPPTTIMVPTGGGPAAEQAARLAFTMAGSETRVLLFHVVDPESATETGMGRASAAGTRMEIGQDIVSDLRKVGLGLGVRVTSEVVMGGAMVANIVERARSGVDLIIVGTSVRSGTRRLFLGPKVERLIRDAPCSTLVLNV
jgi:Kef-type K+ transport system membrane component KefB